MNPCKDNKDTECEHLHKLNGHLDIVEERIMELMRDTNQDHYFTIVGLIEEREKTKSLLHDIHIKIY